MGIFRRRSNESIIAAPQPEVKPVVITASTQLDPRTQVIQLEKISPAQLAILETSGIKPDYADLHNKLQNPAITQADFHDMYAWQAMFFIGTEAQLRAYFTNDSAITGNVTKLNTQGPRVPLFSAALGGNVKAMNMYIVAHQQQFPDKAEHRKKLIQEALYYAARGADPVVAIEYLVSQGADAKQLNSFEHSVLDCAAATGNVDAMRAVEKISGVKGTLKTLYNAINSNHVEAVRHCLQDLKIQPDAHAKDLAIHQDPAISSLFKTPAKPSRFGFSKAPA